MKTYYFLFLTFLYSAICYSQSGKVVAGPMMSFLDSYGTQIWFLLEVDAQKIELDITNYQNDKLLEYDFDVVNEFGFDNYIPYSILLDDLAPNTEYVASIYVDSVFIKEIDIFTQRPHLDNVQMLMGHNMSSSTTLFKHMQNTRSDVMIWLGNHVNIESPYSLQSIYTNYVNVRKNKHLNNFLSSLPQIATWSNLDYGFTHQPNSKLIKDTIHTVFELFWPNSLQKTFNYTFYDYGTYQRYNYNDVDVFLLDAKTFKSEDKSILYGDKQLDRLFQEINNLGSTFTIIASPVPFTFESEESFVNYHQEFNYFMSKLNISDANSIILISAGDVDGTKLYRYNTGAKNEFQSTKSIYEFNISSLSKNEYSMISFKGSKKQRKMFFETYNENGNLLYRKHLTQAQLAF